MRIDRALVKEYQKELEFTLKNKIKGSGDIGLLLKELESQLAQYIGTKYVIALNSGTDAFELSLIVLGIGKGDSVIIPNVTYPTVPLAVIHREAEPILVDIKEEDLNMNEDLIERQIKKDTKAIVATHIFGRSCNIEKILEIAKKYNLYVIEDTCQAFGSTYKGKRLGSFGDLSIFSFAFHKPLSSCGGGGGMVCFNNPKYKETIENYTKSYFDNISTLERDRRFSKMYFLDLISLRVKFKYLKPILQSRQKIKKIYEEELGKIKEIKTFRDKLNSSSMSGLNFIIFAEERNELSEWLNKKGISLVPWQYPCSVLHKMTILKKYAKGIYPVSETYYKKALYLPLFSFMKEEEAMYVVDLIKKSYKR
jgi:dTDP-4-amino-4,6-dideoxygalactose transaminase